MSPFLALQNFAQNGGDNNEELEDALGPWDLNKTIAVVWPKSAHQKKAKKNTIVLSPPLYLSIAYEEEYALAQEVTQYLLRCLQVRSFYHLTSPPYYFLS